LAKINDSLNYGAAKNYRQAGLTYIDVPELVGITGACENVDTLFKIKNRLDLPLFLTQTGQLSLEQALQTFHGVFTVIHSGRDEEQEDERHLRQFRLTEEEFDCTLAGMIRANYEEELMFEALLNHIQKTIQSMVKEVSEQNAAILEKVYHRKISLLETATKTNFLKISYENAVKVLNKNGYPDLKFGDDLVATHEAKIVKLLNNKNGELPVFITRYPKEIKFFNMKVSQKDPRVVLSADLIFPYAGEGTGSAVREHNFERLNSRLISSTMYKLHTERGGKYEDFGWYLNIIKNKSTNPHAGYGIGNERVLQYIFGETDIRNVSLFSLLSRETGDWDEKKYGQSGIISSTKKYILLTIGRTSNKKYLLSHIKKLAKNNDYILYATKNTHEFLKRHGVTTSLVYKISEIRKKPNIVELLNRRVFDIIINIPTRKKIKPNKEFTDGKLIRKGAIEMGAFLITDIEVATVVIQSLINKN
jgi:asparaginyl-tRNA synthetase